jgi:predicted XRE-type DNA-binding protein
MMRTMEIWRKHHRFAEYEISDHGRARRCVGGQGTRAGRTLKAARNKVTGYFRFIFSSGNRSSSEYVHRAVLATFVGPCPDGMEGTHRNGDKADNKLTNLRWATHADNIADKHEHGTVLRGQHVGNSKLTEADVIAIRQATGLQREIAARFGISRTNVSVIRSGKIWKHLQSAPGVSVRGPARDRFPVLGKRGRRRDAPAAVDW